MSLPPFSESELEAITATVEDSMLDLCTIDAYTEEAGELNEPLVTYVSGRPTACRYRATTGVSRPGSGYELAGIDGVLHLPLDTVITNRDRVTITRRFGQRLTSVHTYDVVGDPSPGIASLEVKLQEMHL